MNYPPEDLLLLAKISSLVCLNFPCSQKMEPPMSLGNR